MAALEVDGDVLVLRLRAIEKAEGAHSDIRVPLSAVTAVRSVDDPWPELRGIRAPGTGLPNVVVDLEGAAYGRLVVTADDAAARARSIARATDKT